MADGDGSRTAAASNADGDAPEPPSCTLPKAATSATLKGAALAVKLSCPKASGNACTGTLALTTKAKFGGHRVALGTHTFSVRAGRSTTVTFTVKASVVAIVRRQHALATTLALKGSAFVSGSLTIKG